VTRPLPHPAAETRRLRGNATRIPPAVTASAIPACVAKRLGAASRRVGPRGRVTHPPARRRPRGVARAGGLSASRPRGARRARGRRLRAESAPPRGAARGARRPPRGCATAAAAGTTTGGRVCHAATGPAWPSEALRPRVRRQGPTLRAGSGDEGFDVASGGAGGGAALGVHHHDHRARWGARRGGHIGPRAARRCSRVSRCPTKQRHRHEPDQRQPTSAQGRALARRRRRHRHPLGQRNPAATRRRARRIVARCISAARWVSAARCAADGLRLSCRPALLRRTLRRRGAARERLYAVRAAVLRGGLLHGRELLGGLCSGHLRLPQPEPLTALRGGDLRGPSLRPEQLRPLRAAVPLGTALSERRVHAVAGGRCVNATRPCGAVAMHPAADRRSAPRCGSGAPPQWVFQPPPRKRHAS
jgi:hypothetical protein